MGLEHIKARAEAATSGPWEIDDESDYPIDVVRIVREPGVTHVHHIAPSVIWENDAEFIANAREDVPRLVAALQAVGDVMDALDTARANGHIHTYGQIQQAVRDAIATALEPADD